MADGAKYHPWASTDNLEENKKSEAHIWAVAQHIYCSFSFFFVLQLKFDQKSLTFCNIPLFKGISNAVTKTLHQTAPRGLYLKYYKEVNRYIMDTWSTTIKIPLVSFFFFFFAAAN